MNALPLYDALVGIDVPPDKARAVVDALEQDMTTTLATKQDLALQELALKADMAQLRHELELLRSSLTLRLGSMMFVGLTLLFAALKLT